MTIHTPNPEHFKPNPELIGHHPRSVKVFLGERQIFINEKFKIRFSR
jgi:hypothetical protein